MLQIRQTLDDMLDREGQPTVSCLETDNKLVASVDTTAHKDLPAVFSDWEFSLGSDSDWKQAIEDVVIRFVDKFDDNVNNLPNYRISKQRALNQLQQQHRFDLVPKLPATFRELTAAEYQASKVQASTMEQTKQRNVVAFLN